MTQENKTDPRSDSGTNRALHSDMSVSILRYCITTVMLGSIALALALLTLAPDQLERVGSALAVFLIGFSAWFLLRRGLVRVAIYVLVAGLWASVTGVVVFTGGVRAPLVIVYPSIIMVAGWLISSRAAVWTGGATVFVTLGLLWLESSGGLPSAFPSSPLMYGGDQVIVYSLMAVLTYLLVRDYLGRFNELRHISDTLTLRTVDLEASQTELKQAQVALQESESRYRTLIEWSPESILVHRQGIILYVNPAAVKMFGAPDANALLGKRTQTFIHPDYRESQSKRLSSILAKESMPPMVESRFLQLDGTPIDVEVQGTAIEYDGIPAIHVSIRNITERKQMQDRVHQLAFYDALTHLPNRRLLDDRLKQALAVNQRRARFGALMFLDLDKLKPINDTHGHEAGDALLIEVARRLSQCVRVGDTVARLGGDEFVVMLTDLGSDFTESVSQAGVVAEKIWSVLAEPYRLNIGEAASAQLVVDCAASIGVVLFGDTETSPKNLLKRADMAMYQAKKAGGNLVVFEDA